MPVRESEAIILRTFPLGEGDRLVSFLSRNEGRLRGVAAGARKPKSRFGSTLELLSYVRISYYERETRDLVRISHCELLESFYELQQDYSVGVAIALISEITEAVLGEKEVAEAHFRLLLLLARGLKQGISADLVLAYFGLWTIRLGGWLPSLNHCANCRALLTADAYVADMRFFCSVCRPPASLVILRDVLEIGRKMLTANLEAASQTGEPKSVRQASNLMLNMIEERIEKRLRTRKMLLQSSEGLPL